MCCGAPSIANHAIAMPITRQSSQLFDQSIVSRQARWLVALISWPANFILAGQAAFGVSKCSEEQSTEMAMNALSKRYVDIDQLQCKIGNLNWSELWRSTPHFSGLG
jgi:hypothetical protein